MPQSFMAPRSYVYSGGDLRDARRVAAYDEGAPSTAYAEAPEGVSIASTPAGVPNAGGAPTRGGGGGFFRVLDDISSKLAPFVEAAVAFKQGYQGYPLPGRGMNDSRMAGDRFIYEVLQDMQQRNEKASEQSRRDREVARQEDMRNQLILKGVEKGEITLADALKAIEANRAEVGATGPTVPPQAPAK